MLGVYKLLMSFSSFQLKVYASWPVATSRIDNTLQAKAYNQNTIDQHLYRDPIFNNADYPGLLYCFQIFFPIVAVILSLVYVYCYILGEKISIEDYAKDCNNWATIIAHTTIGFTFLLYVFVLDIAALVYRDSRITDTAYYKTQKNDLLFFYTVPLFLWDIIALIIFILLPVMRTKICLEQLKKHLEGWESFQLSDKDLFVLLAAAGTVPELLCLASHAHYIIIAWILDPIYATGIGIYYSIFYVMHLAVLKQTYKGAYKKTVSINMAVRAMLVVYAGTVIFQMLVTVFVVYIPINNAIENTPTRLSTIIQGVATLFLGLITYKIIITDPKKTSTVKSAIRNEEISDQEQALNQNDCS